jgi:(+)-pinoresinol hydroxylase
MASSLPPGLTAANFALAVARLKEVVHADWVFTSDDDVLLYRDAYSPFLNEPEEYIPSGAVAPENVEQIQEIVKIANAFGLPLWTVSTGRNLGYGGSAPRLSGTLVLDLKRMNRILEVNEPLAYALLEPGVSYFDFYRHIREKKLKVWLDCPDPGWGSVVGNALDHGLGATPYRDHFDAHCGMEVVLANGQIMRTGMGALPGAATWNTFKYGFGPHISPIFGQSNFGIVTKMGIQLFPEPEAAQSMVLSVPRHGDLIPFVEIMSNLVNRGIVDCLWSIGSPVLDSHDADVMAALKSGYTYGDLENLAKAKSVGYWGTRLWLYGPPQVIDAQVAYIRQRLSIIAGATLTIADTYAFSSSEPIKVDDDPFGQPGGDPTRLASIGIPSMSIFSVGAAARQHGHLFFSPIIPMTGEALLKAQEVFGAAFKKLGMPSRPMVIQPFAWFRRNFILLFIFPISEDKGANQKLRENVRALISIAAQNGWSEYRTPAAFMDNVMSTMSFNGHALPKFLETIKDAVDPNGILAPGKSGIWPKKYRKENS